MIVISIFMSLILALSIEHVLNLLRVLGGWCQLYPSGDATVMRGRETFDTLFVQSNCLCRDRFGLHKLVETWIEMKLPMFCTRSTSRNVCLISGSQ